MYGADVRALRSLAGALDRRRREIEVTHRRVGALVDALDWAGPDRDAFVDEWRRVHAPSLAVVADELGDASARARYHAGRQEQASDH